MVWAPSPCTGVVYGDVQLATTMPLSTWQVNVAPASELKPNVGVGSLVSPLGPLTMVVAGGVRSIVTVRVERPMLPAASTARISTVWPPAVDACVVYGDEHSSKVAVSTRQAVEATGPSVVKANVGVVSLVVAGLPVIVTTGGVVSTLNVALAGLGSVFPSAVDGSDPERVWPFG